MKSIYDFIVEPLGDEYSNKIKVGDKQLIVNTGIEDFKFVNRLAKVLETPKAFSTSIKIGDTIVIHQNVFQEDRLNTPDEHRYLLPKLWNSASF